MKSYWERIKKGQNKVVYDTMLKSNDILRADMDQYLQEKHSRMGQEKLTPEMKAQRLLEYVTTYGKVPIVGSQTVIDQYKFDMGMYWTSIKGGHNKVVYDTMLKSNDILRHDMERYLQKKQSREKLSPETKAQRLLEYVTTYGKVPPGKSQMVIDQYKFDMFSYWTSIKSGKNKVVYDTMLESNDILRHDMNRYLQEKQSRMLKETLTPETKAQRLMEYVTTYGKVPTRNSQSVIDQYKFDMGMFWTRIKCGKHKYHTMLKSNDILRADMERYQSKKRKADSISGSDEDEQ